MVEDAITICVGNGYDPEWLMLLSTEDFQGIYSSVMRVKSRDRLWELNAITVASNPQGKKDKNRESMIDSINTWIPWAEIKQSMGNAEGFKQIVNK